MGRRLPRKGDLAIFFPKPLPMNVGGPQPPAFVSSFGNGGLVPENVAIATSSFTIARQMDVGGSHGPPRSFWCGIKGFDIGYWYG